MEVSRSVSWVISARILIDWTTHLRDCNSKIPKRMVDVVSTPFTVHRAASKRTNESKHALINIDLNVNHESSDIQFPCSSGAEVFIVYNIDAHVVVKESASCRPSIKVHVELKVPQLNR